MLEWQERATSLAPAGMVASGALARSLLCELQRREAASWQGLTLLATRDMVVLLGDAGRLPWLDGARYCAPDPAAPALWLPTHLAPSLPPDLVLAALQRRTQNTRLLLWPAPEQLLPLDGVRPVTEELLAWLEQELD